MHSENDKLNLVLDLDETLVHTLAIKLNNLEKIKDFSCNSNLLLQYQDDDFRYIAFYRPYLFDFIKNMSQYYNLFIYTHGSKQYCTIIVNMIVALLEHNPFKHVQYRSENIPTFKYISVLSIDPHKTIIIDDCPYVWNHGQQNIFSIKKFFGPECSEYLNDNELKILEIELHDIIATYKKNKNVHISQLVQLKNDKYMNKQTFNLHDEVDNELSSYINNRNNDKEKDDEIESDLFGNDGRSSTLTHNDLMIERQSREHLSW